MNENREQLLRFLEGDLPEADARALQERMATEPGLRAQVDRLRALRDTLQADKPDAFAPYFSERVLRRLGTGATAEGAEALYESLRWVFARATIAGLAAAGALGTLNVLDYQSLGVAASFVEALFGLPSTSLADALAYGAM